MPLEELHFHFRPHRDTALLRSITTLTEINGQSAAAFWKDFAEFTDASQTLKDPAFQQWLKVVSALAAVEQVEAVSKKLRELNPSFDGKLQHKIDNGTVTELKFISDKVWNIAPVRALVGLKSFDCSGSKHNATDAKVVDLSPLTGLNLIEFHCVGTLVFDLSPLRGMPLTTLEVGAGPIFDLTPLREMPLTSLSCALTPISDLNQIKNLQLTFLNVNGTFVKDLSPIRNMPLKTLHVGGTSISDFSPLAGMRLIGLGFAYTNVTDLSPISTHPLTHIYCDFKPERHTELLRSIKTLEMINDKPAAEFWKEVEKQKAAKKQ